MVIGSRLGLIDKDLRQNVTQKEVSRAENYPQKIRDSSLGSGSSDPQPHGQQKEGRRLPIIRGYMGGHSPGPSSVSPLAEHSRVKLSAYRQQSALLYTELKPRSEEIRLVNLQPRNWGNDIRCRELQKANPTYLEKGPHLFEAILSTSGVIEIRIMSLAIS